MLKLKIFGWFHAEDEFGNEVLIKSKKARALLAYLALPPGKPHSREELMALLWSDRGDDQARGSLRQALSGLRRDLGDHLEGVLRISDDAVSLDPSEVLVESRSSRDELLEGLHINDPAFDEWLRDERLRLADECVADQSQAVAEEPFSKPSIAVLPFVNLSNDPEQEYFADGITEDIITELSRFRELSVIARNSTFYYKGQSPKVQDVGRELGVRYVVEGSVRKAGKRVRITAQLIEVGSSDHIWAERYDRDLEDIFAVQDEVTRNVVSTVAGRIDAVGHQRASRMDPDSLKAYDLCLRAHALFLRFNPADNAASRALLERAIALAPAYSRPYARLCATHYMDWIGHWVGDGDHALTEAIRWGKQAVAADDTDCRAHWNLAEAYLFARMFDKARFHLERAIQLNPNDVEVRTCYGLFLACVQEADAALVEFEQARQVDPRDLNYLPWLEGFAYFTARRYDEAIACLEKVEDPHFEICSLLAASYAYVGRLDDAKVMLDEFLRKAAQEMVDFPGRSSAAWKKSWRSLTSYKDDADVDHWINGLNKAGLSA